MLRYGIPNFKMEKHLIDRRLEQMRAEGVKFQANAHVGGNVPAEDLRREFHAILLAGGAEHPRDLPVPGRELRGIHYAMEFLPQQNRRNEGDTVPDEQVILPGRDALPGVRQTAHEGGAYARHGLRPAGHLRADRDQRDRLPDRGQERVEHLGRSVGKRCHQRCAARQLEHPSAQGRARA